MKNLVDEELMRKVASGNIFLQLQDKVESLALSLMVFMPDHNNWEVGILVLLVAEECVVVLAGWYIEFREIMQCKLTLAATNSKRTRRVGEERASVSERGGGFA